MRTSLNLQRIRRTSEKSMSWWQETGISANMEQSSLARFWSSCMDVNSKALRNAACNRRFSGRSGVNSGGTDSATSAIITPAFLLEGRASRWQDSLFERLKYLETRTSPSSFTLTNLAFRNGQDSSVQLCATYEDDRRQNSHGLSPEQIRALERDRILSLRPLWVFARQSKIAVPVVVRSVFKSRDYLFQNARMIEDTAEVVLPETVGKPAK